MKGGGDFDHAGVQRRSDNVDLQRLCRKQSGTDVGQLALRRLLSALDCVPGGRERRPASASQPLGSRRPPMAIQALLSTALRHNLQQADFMRGGVKGVHALLERGWLLCDPIQPPDEAVVACRSCSNWSDGVRIGQGSRAHTSGLLGPGPGWAAELAPSQMGTTCDKSTVQTVGRTV